MMKYCAWYSVTTAYPIAIQGLGVLTHYSHRSAAAVLTLDMALMNVPAQHHTATSATLKDILPLPGSALNIKPDLYKQ